jgi:hypothetical protein
MNYYCKYCGTKAANIASLKDPTMTADIVSAFLPMKSCHGQIVALNLRTRSEN